LHSQLGIASSRGVAAERSGNTTTHNIFFDPRFAQNGFAPPWYPSTTVTSSGTSSANMTTTIQRTKWFNRTTY